MDYFGILTTAVKTLWKHKIIYAFLLIFTSIPTILPMLLMGVFAFSVDMNHPERWLDVVDQPFAGSNLPVMVGLTGVYLLLMLLSFFCTVIGYIGVLKGSAISERAAEPVNFSTLWQDGLKYFWRVSAVFIMAGAVAFAFLLVMIIPSFVIGPFILLAFCILIPLFSVGRIMVETLIAAIVADDLGLANGLNRFWQIIQERVGPLALMMVLLLAIDIVAYMVLFMPMSILQQVVMQFLVFLPGQQETPSMMPGNIFRWMMIFQILSYPILIVLQTVITAFHLAAVSVFYVRIPSSPVPPELPAEAVAAG